MDYILAYTLIHEVTKRSARQTPESDWYVDAAPRYRPTPGLWSRLRRVLGGRGRSACEPARPTVIPGLDPGTLCRPSSVPQR